MNTVSLIGRLTKGIDLKYTQNGTAVASFTLAVNRSFKNQNGEYEADFIQCVAWKKTAELMANYTDKGTQIGVNGRIQTRNYENQQGQRVYVTEVVVENLTFVEKVNRNQNGQMQNNQNFNNQGNNQNFNQGNSQSFNQNNNQGFNGFSGATPITPDGLPF